MIQTTDRAKVILCNAYSDCKRVQQYCVRRHMGQFWLSRWALALVVGPVAFAVTCSSAGAQAIVATKKTNPPKSSGFTSVRIPIKRRASEVRPQENSEINRSILALYDGVEEPAPDVTRIHKLLEMPLNHLGFRVTYWDLRRGLPPLDEARKHRAVATWFNERIPHHQAYLAWARSLAAARQRFVVMDFVGAHLDDKDLPAVNAFLGHLGVAVRSAWIAPSKDLRVVLQRDDSIGFERRLDGEIPGTMMYKATKGAARMHVVVGQPGDNEAQSSHPVVTGPGGGFAADGFTAVYDEKTERTSWVLNPFTFLASALGDEDAPIPDATTLVGRRIYFSHIDGDGWNSVSHITRDGRPDQLVSEVVLDDLIKAYPDLPVSVGVIGGDVDASIAGKPRAARIAREYYRQPHVEVASHSYTHPYDWGSFAKPEWEREQVLLKEAELLPIKGDPLRAYAKRPFDLTQEVDGALDVTAALAPAGKRPALYLWSGNTRPFAQAIRATRTYGVRNLNGGDTRFDAAYPSVAYVSPLSRQIDGERQIYTASANETIYTQGWTAPFDRFMQLEETLRNTESPRRLKPFNVYYHMYSGERPESLAAVKHHLDLARVSMVVPVAASHYAAIADSFFGVRIVQAGRDAWRIVNRGDLQTMRFDNAAGLSPDYARSTGLLGHGVTGGSLYVALDPAHTSPVLALTRGTQPATLVSGRPVLLESRWPLSGLHPLPCGFDVSAKGFGPGQMTWMGLRPGAYSVTASRNGQVLATVPAQADVAGKLAFEITADAIEGLQLTVACQR
jgi:polysaccharide biosynthesis protein PelA